jgi:hypothetical protein
VVAALIKLEKEMLNEQEDGEDGGC